MMPRCCWSSTNRGVALILVLWFIVLLSVLSLGLSKVSRNGALLARQLTGAAQARYLAEGGIQMVLANLLMATEEERLLGDGEVFELSLGQGRVQAVLWDESGKIDINKASEALLTRLFLVIELSPQHSAELAAAIADWRDEDDLARLHGAEDEDYLAYGLTYGAADSPFTHIIELRQVLGMDESTYQQIEAYVTIHSKSAGINPKVAPELILLAVSDAQVSTIEYYINERRRTYQAGLPMPPAPSIHQDYLAKSGDSVFSLSTQATLEQGISAGKSLVFKLMGNAGDMTIKKLYSQPYGLKLNEIDSFDTRQRALN